MNKNAKFCDKTLKEKPVEIIISTIYFLILHNKHETTIIMPHPVC